ncbi:MAG: flagellar hook capping FlgD N-terminal domain-containing protein [Pseudomonadota bacterium]
MDFTTITNNVASAAGATTATNGGDEEGAAPSAAEASSNEVSEQFDTFLNLLTAQISNQDPLAPLDSTQFVEQLATFSNLELQATTNQILEGISNLLASQIDGNDNGPATVDDI